MPHLTGTSNKLILAHHRALGDIVTMTALVRDIALHCPGQYEIAVDTSYHDVWHHNPHLVPTPKSKDRAGWRYIKLSYGDGIKDARTIRKHFLMAWHDNLRKQTGIDIPLLHPKPDLHLSHAEKKPLVAGRYWILISGWKADFSAKGAVTAHVQTAVHILREFGIKFVQAGATGGKPMNFQPPIDGATNMVGHTGVREFIRLIAHADGVLSPITSAMHLAAAFDKPCVVWGGGREQTFWEAYSRGCQEAFGPRASPVRVSHRFLHTHGMLPCCPTEFGSCWRSKTVSDGKNSKDKSVCSRPVEVGAQIVPECQKLIPPNRIAEAVLSYYLEGILPPP